LRKGIQANSFFQIQLSVLLPFNPFDHFDKLNGNYVGQKGWAAVEDAANAQVGQIVEAAMSFFGIIPLLLYIGVIPFSLSL
jgi:hypothetical protein